MACVVYWSELVLFYILLIFLNSAYPLNSYIHEEVQIKKKNWYNLENFKFLEDCNAKMSNRKKIPTYM